VDVAIQQIGIVPALGYNAFEIVLASKMKEFLTPQLNMVGIEKPFMAGGNDPSQPLLALFEGLISKVFTIAGQKIEGVKAWLTTAKQKIGELRIPILIEADNLTINDCAFSTTFKGKGCTQSRK
jgi:hypothetical protein